MVEESYNTNCQSSRTFSVAMWILGFAAGGQLMATGWAVMRHQPQVTNPELISQHAVAPENGGAAVALTNLPPASPPSTSPPPITAATIPVGGLPPMPEIFRKQMARDKAVLPSPPLDGLGGKEKIRIPRTSPPMNEMLAATARQAHAAHRIADPEIERLLNTGVELRANGNTQAALRILQSATEKLPDHPRILSELAGTYSQLGLDDKAALYWKKVHQLGVARAGAYFDMADMVLKGQQIEQISRKDSLLSISDVAEIRDNNITAGERITLRVTIQAKPGAQPAGNDMALFVYFYDLVDGNQFLRSTADTSESYISAPYDWDNGKTEAIEVTYYQPVFTPEEKRELGERVYYGYIVELYYRDELEDTVAAPRKLTGLNPSAPPTSQGVSNGPNSSLFPK